MGTNPAATVKAFNEAENYNGPAIIIAYAHCIEQGLLTKTGPYPPSDSELREAKWLQGCAPEGGGGVRPLPAVALQPGRRGQEAHARLRRQVRHRLLRIPAPLLGHLLRRQPSAGGYAWRWFAQCANTPEAKARASERRFEGAWREPLQAARQEDRPGQGDGDAQGRTTLATCFASGLRPVDMSRASRRTTRSSRSSPRCRLSGSVARFIRDHTKRRRGT